MYLHGLSSFSVEGSFLIEHVEKLKDQYAVCLYDMRGHGKDKADTITFGIEEAK